MKQHNREELAWAAGFVDGEGHFGLHKTKVRPTDERGYASLELTAAQCDRQVLDRLQAALGLGTIGGPYTKKKENWRQSYLFYVNGFDKTKCAIELLMPWLSPVKKEQAERAIADYYEFNDRPRMKMGPKPKTPTCHPNRRHAARGLCQSCYQLKWRQERHGS